MNGLSNSKKQHGRSERGQHVGLARRRWYRFRRNRRGFYSLLIFAVVFFTSLGAELISNDLPFLVIHDGKVFLPLLKEYPETAFGGDFETETDYRDPCFLELVSGPGDRVFFPFNKHSFSC